MKDFAPTPLFNFELQNDCCLLQRFLSFPCKFFLFQETIPFIVNLFAERFDEYDKALADRDKVIESCNDKIKQLEQTVQQQCIKIEACEANLKIQKEKTKFILKEIGKHSNCLSPFEWIIPGSRLKTGELIFSDKFYAPFSILCFQMGIQFDKSSKELDCYLYRVRGVYDESIARIKNSVEFQYKIYVLDGYGISESYSNNSTVSQGFNIGNDYFRSNGVFCSNFLNPFNWERWISNDQLHIYCEIEQN